MDDRESREAQREPRKLSFFSGALRISVPVPTSFVDRHSVLTVRDLLGQFLGEAAAERRPELHYLSPPVRYKAVFRAVESGSIEYEVILRALVELPWPAIVNHAKRVYEVVKEIGEFAAVVMAIRESARWLIRRLRAHDIPVTEPPEDSPDSEQLVQIINVINVNLTPVESPEDVRRLIGTLVSDDKPGATAIILGRGGAEALADSFLHMAGWSESPFLGGGTLLEDWNLHANGMDSFDQIRSSEPFVLHNAGALGLRRVDRVGTLYAECRRSPAVLTIRDLTVDSYPQEPPPDPSVHEGPTIELSDLPGADSGSDS